jgi:hypothetical protein
MLNDSRPDANPLECDHCGTVERALTLWPEHIHRTCPCMCHVRRNEHNAEAERIQARRRGIITPRKKAT